MSAAAELPWTTQDSETELSLLFDNAPLWFAQCEAPGKIIALNPALERALCQFPRGTRSLHFVDLIASEDRATGLRLMQEMFAGERDSFDLESKNPGDGKVVRWTLWRVSHNHGKRDYAFALAREISKNLQVEQRLREAQQLEVVGRLAGGAAHDFNNLLTGVLLYCDLLIGALEPGLRARTYAEEIRSAGIQASRLVRQLLSVARPAKAEARLLSLNDVAETLWNLLDRLTGENVELTFQLDRGLGLIRMDPTQAQQILLNLVLNARDAMPDGGRITVETSNCKVQILAQSSSAAEAAPSLPCALLVVGDNGCGMDDATRAHLFEPFFTTKGGKGTGLGLATVHDIVTGSGGLIHVQSAPGCGTRVSMLLPLVSESAPSSQDTSNTSPEMKKESSVTEKEAIL